MFVWPSTGRRKQFDISFCNQIPSEDRGCYQTTKAKYRGSAMFSLMFSSILQIAKTISIAWSQGSENSGNSSLENPKGQTKFVQSNFTSEQ